jgi:hypothetical protein
MVAPGSGNRIHLILWRNCKQGVLLRGLMQPHAATREIALEEHFRFARRMDAAILRPSLTGKPFWSSGLEL